MSCRTAGLTAALVAALPGCSAFIGSAGLGLLPGAVRNRAISNVSPGLRGMRGGALGASMGILEGMKAKDIDGNEIDLEAAFGKVPAVLVTNLASA